jgi:hypothetical protein
MGAEASGPGVSSTTFELGRDDPPGTLQRRLLTLWPYPMVVARVAPSSRIDAR